MNTALLDLGKYFDNLKTMTVQSRTLLERGTTRYNIWVNMKKNIYPEGLNQQEVDTLFDFILHYDFLSNPTVKFADILPEDLKIRLKKDEELKREFEDQNEKLKQQNAIKKHQKRIDEIIGKSNDEVDAYYVSMKRPNYQYEVITFKESDALFAKRSPEMHIKAYLNKMAAMGWRLASTYTNEDFTVDTFDLIKVRDRVRTFNDITLILEREIPASLR